MAHQKNCRGRKGAVAVEAAVVFPVVIFVFLGLVLGGMGVFRSQQVVCQAREAARLASVRGASWEFQTNQDSPTQQQILQQAVLPMAAGMDPTMITVQIVWVDQSSGAATAWDSAGKDVRSLNAGGNYVTNTVRVTVTYQWSPGLFGLGPLQLTSVSEVPMSF